MEENLEFFVNPLRSRLNRAQIEARNSQKL